MRLNGKRGGRWGRSIAVPFTGTTPVNRRWISLEELVCLLAFHPSLPRALLPIGPFRCPPRHQSNDPKIPPGPPDPNVHRRVQEARPDQEALAKAPVPEEDPIAAVRGQLPLHLSEDERRRDCKDLCAPYGCEPLWVGCTHLCIVLEVKYTAELHKTHALLKLLNFYRQRDSSLPHRWDSRLP